MKRKLKPSFLFLIAVAFLCLSGTSGLSSLKEGQTGVCGDNPPHGLIKMKYGYDIRNYKSDSMENSRRQEIFAFTCKNKADALLPGYDKKFTFPDQFGTPDPINKQIYNKTVSFSELYEECAYEEQSGLRTNEKSDLIGLIGSAASAAASRWKYAEVIAPVFSLLGGLVDFFTPYKKTVSEYGKLTQNSQYRAWVKTEIKIYDLFYRNPEELTLRDCFVKHYKSLPAVFIDNPLPFTEFLERYGTHYIFKGTFGGQLKYFTRHTISANKTTAKKQIEEEYRHWLEKRVRTEEEKKQLERKIQDQTIEVEVNGGDLSQAVPYESDDIKAWVKSVYKDPNPIKVSLTPIIALISNLSIQVQLAQATVHMINKAQVDNYIDLMNNTITISSLPPHLPHGLPYLQSYSNFRTLYEKRFEEMDISLKAVTATALSMLTNLTKEVHDKFNKLSNLYQNSKAVGELVTEMILFEDIHPAVITVHKIHSYFKKKKFSLYRADTGFGDTEDKYEKFYAAKPIINKLVLSNTMDDPTALHELHELLYELKTANHRYLNSPTFDCGSIDKETVLKRASRDTCYMVTICAVQNNIKGYRSNEPLDKYEDTVPVIKHLRKMLTSMKHWKDWEIYRKYLAEHPAICQKNAQ